MYLTFRPLIHLKTAIKTIDNHVLDYNSQVSLKMILAEYHHFLLITL